MHSARGKRKRIGRWLFILAGCSLYVFLLVSNALDFFPEGQNLSSLNLVRFGFSAFTALIYLTVGSLVWLFARQRVVAALLFCFSLSMMAAFATEAASSLRIPLFSAVMYSSGVIALASFALLLLIFPYNYLDALKTRQKDGRERGARTGRVFLSLYMAGHAICASLVIADILAKNVLAITLPTWLDLPVIFYYLLALVCILVTITSTYCFSSEMRTRQQFLIFAIGVILSAAPLLFLTVLPIALHLPDHYIIDGHLSSLPLLLLPLALGYSILRYQILVFDRYIRQMVAWTVGVISLAVLSYLIVILSRIAFTTPGLWLAHIICVTACMALLGPLTWWFARVVTDRLFFPEIRHYQRHMQRPELLTRETVDLNEAAELIMLAAMQTFETQEVCLYVLDERAGYYRLSQMRETYRAWGGTRGQLLWQLANFNRLFNDGDVNSVEARHPVIQRLAEAQRPLFLYEALDEVGEPTGLARYLVTTAYEKVNPLLVPVRAQGKMIGVLCLGERGDAQPYAGPDFEVLHLLLARFASILETARLYVQASRHVALLNALYSASARLERNYLHIEEVATAYATVVAEAMQAAAEIWLYIPERVVLHRVVHAGQGPSLLQQEWISQIQEQDWSAWFQEGTGTGAITNPAYGLPRPEPTPTCLAHMSGAPFAWLPLCKGQRRMGVLVLSFEQAHIFSIEEKRVLGMFARQCAAAMENAQITIALRGAYERQKELDRLKDQFIMTASHELRTPLTAVQGYIELLSQFNDEISVDTRTEFIQKAHRGCDELALMVGNIMDASRLKTEKEHMRLVPVDLAACVKHVAEILESMTRREQRLVTLSVPPGLFVLADDLRLRQILLNLLSNALKYSPAGSPIYIQAFQGQGLVKISVRDYGLGIPPADQDRLFERFVRLERDMNSPVRGAGLGLYITRRLVDAMNGRLWVVSSGIPGEGSTFAFTLQRASLPQRPVDEAPLLARQGR